MKTNGMRTACLAAATILLLALAACLPDRATWSPDGKTLYYVCPEDGALAARNVETGETKRLFHDPSAKVSFCFAAGKSGAVYFTTERRGPDPNNPLHDLSVVTPKGDVKRDVLKEIAPEGGMAASADGSRAFCVKGDRDKKICELWEIDLAGDSATAKKIFAQTGKGGGGDFGYLCATADGSKVLLTFETGIGEFEVKSGKVDMIVKATKEFPAMYGVYAMGETAVAYIESRPKKEKPDEASGLGRLALIDLKDKSIRRLAEGVPILRRPMLDATGTTAYITRADMGGAEKELEMDSAPISKIQVEAIDLKSGAAKKLTDDPQGGEWPAPDPTGKWLAYFSVKKGTDGGYPAGLDMKIMKLGGAAEALACPAK